MLGRGELDCRSSRCAMQGQNCIFFSPCHGCPGFLSSRNSAWLHDIASPIEGQLDARKAMTRRCSVASQGCASRTSIRRTCGRNLGPRSADTKIIDVIALRVTEMGLRCVQAGSCQSNQVVFDDHMPGPKRAVSISRCQHSVGTNSASGETLFLARYRSPDLCDDWRTV